MNKNIIKLFAILVMCFMICAVLVACGNAQGPQGPKGDPGASVTGPKGDDGKDGTKVTIGADGYFYLDGVNTGVKAKGEDATECNLADHDWEIEDFRPHTQYSTGVKIGICSDCGDAKWFIEDHDYSIEALTAPTCTVDGYIEYSCACGKDAPELTKVVPATGHTYDAVVTAPTCLDKGYTTYTCACGDTYVDDYVDALGHDHVLFDENNIDPSWSLAEPKEGLEPCMEQDVYVTNCKRCNVEIEALTSALGHIWGEWELAEPDRDTCACLVNEVYVRSCTRPGCDHEEEKLGAVNGHNWSAWKVTVDPTLATTGLAIRECANECAKCGGHCYEELVLPVLNDQDYTLVTVDSTCAKTGTHTYTYKKADVKSFVLTIDKKAHNYEGASYDVTLAPTATAEGSVKVLCTACGEAKNVVLPVLGDSNYVITNGNCDKPVDLYEITLDVDGAEVVVAFGVNANYPHAITNPEKLEVEGDFYIYTVQYCDTCKTWVVVDAQLKD